MPTTSDPDTYAAYFFPQALEALGDPVKPYVTDPDTAPYILCEEIDTAGAFVELTVQSVDAQGTVQMVELMVPTNMVKLVVSRPSSGRFGFRPNAAQPPAGISTA